MSANSRKSKKNRRQGRDGRRAKRTTLPARPACPPETAASDALTVAWMVSLLASLIAELTGLACYAIRLQNESGVLATLVATLMAVAVISGVITLILTVITVRIRKTAPPRSIVVAAMLVGVAPLITTWWLAR